MENFTPIASTIGGLLIGLAGIAFLALSGRIAGISGIVGGILGAPATDRRWRFAFLAGLLAGGWALAVFHPPALSMEPLPSVTRLVVAGLLVGFGTRLGSGCTSGHGVCGLGRLSRRSLAATATFMTTAIVTVFVTRHVVGG